MADSSPARPGRRRDPGRDTAILEATLDVLADQGYARLTMDAVAHRAKAGKATVYRRWPSKERLVLDALRALDADATARDAPPDTGSLRSDALALLLPETDATIRRRLDVMVGITPMLTDSPELADTATAVIVEPWVEANRIILRRAVERGEIGPATDVETLAWVIPSMTMYRLAVQHRPAPAEWVTMLLDNVLLPAVGLRP